MTATEELRRLLDERGVPYGGSDAVVYFEDVRGYRVSAYDAPRRYGEGILCVSHTASPEQAIEATLGRGTCHPEEQYLDMHSDLTVTVCSECGVPTDDLEDCNFCPSCGRKVVA